MKVRLVYGEERRGVPRRGRSARLTVASCSQERHRQPRLPWGMTRALRWFAQSREWLPASGDQADGPRPGGSHCRQAARGRVTARVRARGVSAAPRPDVKHVPGG